MRESSGWCSSPKTVHHKKYVEKQQTPGTALWRRVLFPMHPIIAETESEGSIMALFDVGRVVLKIAGRDAGRKAVVVEVLDSQYVLIDGNTRRKKVNVKHLEPTAQMLDIDSGASHDVVKKEFEKIGLSVWETKAKSASSRPHQKRKAVEKNLARAQTADTSKPAKKKTVKK